MHEKISSRDQARIEKTEGVDGGFIEVEVEHYQREPFIFQTGRCLWKIPRPKNNVAAIPDELGNRFLRGILETVISGYFQIICGKSFKSIKKI